MDPGGNEIQLIGIINEFLCYIMSFGCPVCYSLSICRWLFNLFKDTAAEIAGQVYMIWSLDLSWCSGFFNVNRLYEFVAQSLDAESIKPVTLGDTSQSQSNGTRASNGHVLHPEDSSSRVVPKLEEAVVEDDATLENGESELSQVTSEENEGDKIVEEESPGPSMETQNKAPRKMVSINDDVEEIYFSKKKKKKKKKSTEKVPSIKEQVKEEIKPLKSILKTRIHCVSGEGASRVVIPKNLVLNVGLKSNIVAKDDIRNSPRNFNGEVIEIPVPPYQDIFDPSILVLLVQMTMNDASKAVKMRDPGVLEKIYPVPFTYSPSNTQTTVFPTPFNVLPGSRGRGFARPQPPMILVSSQDLLTEKVKLIFFMAATPNKIPLDLINHLSNFTGDPNIMHKVGGSAGENQIPKILAKVLAGLDVKGMSTLIYHLRSTVGRVDCLGFLIINGLARKGSEGVIPELVSVSVNGNNKAKAMALELLRLLKGEFSDIGESHEPAKGETVLFFN
ncbi:hypothetical protein CQW23_20014 [Capsicum baccatum]|uniref:Uncharacterized protein n=1 Tax=Capsicum baccatum TaxID=33114 RepID=A0A2G2W7E7_CAPBA|nr:hypothetical protein CQW23_20014 [Capsicum baccatum]